MHNKALALLCRLCMVMYQLCAQRRHSSQNAPLHEPQSTPRICHCTSQIIPKVIHAQHSTQNHTKICCVALHNEKDIYCASYTVLAPQWYGSRHSAQSMSFCTFTTKCGGVLFDSTNHTHHINLTPTIFLHGRCVGGIGNGPHMRGNMLPWFMGGDRPASKCK